MISALPNAAKAINYVFNDGLDTVLGERLGLSTGDVSKFSTFDEFYEAFIKQFKFILGLPPEVSPVTVSDCWRGTWGLQMPG